MKDSRSPYMLLIAGGAIVAVGTFLALIYPEIENSERIERETVELHSKLDGYLRSLDMVNAYIHRRDSLNQRRTELAARLYARDDVLALIERLKESAESHNVKVQEISPSVVELLSMNDRPPSDDEPQQVNISLRISAAANEAGRLLKEMETEPYFVDLLNLHVVGRDRGFEQADYVMHFRAQLGSLPVASVVSR